MKPRSSITRMLQYAIILTSYYNYALHRLTMHSHNSDRMSMHALKLRSADITRCNNTAWRTVAAELDLKNIREIHPHRHVCFVDFGTDVRG